jgi:hypothetical protein
MIIYNVTVNIEASVHEEWLQWMKTSHIPDLMRTGMFKDSRILRVLGDEDSGGLTYCVQYTLDDMEKFQQYEDIYAPAFRGEFNSRYQDKFVLFRTLLETID